MGDDRVTDVRGPDVTVILGAYNAMPYVPDALASAVNQSIGPSRMEIIAVDDGSTDGSGTVLDEAAASHANVRVIHQPNSGCPGAPRNVGLEHATGRFVFFLDADDMLAPEALERLVRMADDNGSDVVLGRMAPIGKRTVPTSMFTHNQPHADLYASNVYRSLRAQRLFRRDLLERHHIRFPEIKLGEDQLFAALAYLHARTISVLADYDCYYLRARDGRNLTVLCADASAWTSQLEQLLSLVAARVKPGARRDLLMRKHFDDAMRQTFGKHFLSDDRDTQADVVSRVAKLLELYYTPLVSAGLPALTRITYALVAAGNVEAVATMVGTRPKGPPAHIIEDGRVYACYPFFRDADLRLPDALFDVTGRQGAQCGLDGMTWHGTRLVLRGFAFIERVPAADQRTTVVLRERRSGTRHEAPAAVTPSPGLSERYEHGRYDYGMAGFVADIDLATVARGAALPAGSWDAYVRVTAHGITRETRLGHERSPDIHIAARPRVVRHGPGGTLVTPYFTKRFGDLTIDVGDQARRLRPVVTVTGVTWGAGRDPELVVTGRLELGGFAPLPDAILEIVARGPGGVELRARADLRAGDGDRDFIAVLPLSGARTGRSRSGGAWQVRAVVSCCGVVRTCRVPHVAPLPSRRINGRPAARVMSATRAGAGTLELTVVGDAPRRRAHLRRLLRVPRRAGRARRRGLARR